MADILDKKPVDAEMTIFKTEVEPNKLNACIDNILIRLNRLETKLADKQIVKCVKCKQAFVALDIKIREDKYGR